MGKYNVLFKSSRISYFNFECGYDDSGFYVAKMFASGIAQRKCISLECGLQNGTLAVFVATQIFSDIIYIIPTAAYALIMFATSIIFIFIVRNLN